MVMRIIASRHIGNYARTHPTTASSLYHWLTVANAASWSTPNDVLRSFKNAKVINGARVRFEVAGGNHRLICAFHWPSRTCYVKFLGSHKEYDAIDAETISMF